MGQEDESNIKNASLKGNALAEIQDGHLDKQGFFLWPGINSVIAH